MHVVSTWGRLSSDNSEVTPNVSMGNYTEIPNIGSGRELLETFALSVFHLAVEVLREVTLNRGACQHFVKRSSDLEASPKQDERILLGECYLFSP